MCVCVCVCVRACVFIVNINVNFIYYFIYRHYLACLGVYSAVARILYLVILHSLVLPKQPNHMLYIYRSINVC